MTKPAQIPPTRHAATSRTRRALDALRRDVAQALRVIAKTPGVSAIAILSLALGVAANVTVFGLANAFLLRPLPYPEPDRLVLAFQNPLGQANAQDLVSPATFFDWRESQTAFESLEAVRFGHVELSGGERPEQLTASFVTPGLFDTLGSKPSDGRGFSAGEGEPGRAAVVISERFWQRHLGADPDVIGRAIELDGEAHTVVGTMPESFDFLMGSVDAWIAEDLADRRDDRRVQDLLVVGRLAEGSTLGDARDELAARTARLAEQYPDQLEGVGAHLMTVREQFPGQVDTRLVQVLMLVVLMVLLVACANVGSLLLSKADARSKEMAVRVALGAGKGRLLRQLLTESVTMALVAGSLGLAFGWVGVRAVGDSMPDMLPAIFVPRFDAAVVGYGLAISALAGLAFGIGPALQAVRGHLRTALVDSSRGGTAGRERKRLLAGFVVAEFALALAILVGAAVITDLFHDRLAIDPGFESAGVLTAQLPLSEHRLGEDADLVRFARDLETELAEIPGVSAASIATRLPRGRERGWQNFEIEGRPAERGEEPQAGVLAVGPGYFETLEIALVRGRGFGLGDEGLANDPEAAAVAVVDERFAELFFDGESPLGRRLSMGEGESERSIEIVGLAQNVAQHRLSGLMPAAPTLYLPFAQAPTRQVFTLARADGTNRDPYRLRDSLQGAIWSLAPDQPVAAVKSLDDHVAEALAGPDMVSRVLYLVGLLALALAALGIYGVMAFRVRQQRAEIGVRMALGAGPRRVLGQVGRQGATLAGLGLALGVPAAAGIVWLIGGMFGDDTPDGLLPAEGIVVGPMAQVAGLLVVAGLVACWLPALRATRIDPATVLQEE